MNHFWCFYVLAFKYHTCNLIIPLFNNHFNHMKTKIKKMIIFVNILCTEDGGDNFFWGMIVFLGWKMFWKFVEKRNLLWKFEKKNYFFGKKPLNFWNLKFEKKTLMWRFVKYFKKNKIFSFQLSLVILIHCIEIKNFSRF